MILDAIQNYRLLLAHLEVLKSSGFLPCAWIDLACKFEVYLKKFLSHKLLKIVDLIWDSILEHFEDLLEYFQVICSLLDLKDYETLHANTFTLDVFIEFAIGWELNAFSKLLASTPNEFGSEFRLKLHTRKSDEDIAHVIMHARLFVICESAFLCFLIEVQTLVKVESLIVEILAINELFHTLDALLCLK